METQQEFDINKYRQLLYEKRYAVVVIAVIITTIAIVVSYILPKKYEATSTVLIERNFTNQLIKGLAVESIDDREKAVETILKSRSLILKVLGDLDLDLTRKSDAEVERLVRAFQDKTVVGIEMNRVTRKDMDTFTVTVQTDKPSIARDYVNTLVRRYIEESLSHNREEMYGANKFLMEQIELFKGKINAIETEIARMSKQPNKDTGPVMEDKLSILQKRLDELRLQYTDSHPEIIKLKAEMESVRNNIGVSENGKKSNRNTDNTQKKGAEFVTSKSSDKQKIAALERDRDTYQKIYEDLMAALGRSQVSNQIEQRDKGSVFNIVEPAVLPLNPVSPNRVKIILLGLLAGIGGGVAFIIMLDSMDKSVRTMDTLKSFGLPVLAVIPHIQNTADAQKTKRKDILLYAIVGVYYAFVIVLLSFEFLKRGSL